jgi:hypothetical protein
MRVTMRTYWDGNMRGIGFSLGWAGSLVMGILFLFWSVIRLAIGIVWLLVKFVVWACSGIAGYTRKRFSGRYVPYYLRK